MLILTENEEEKERWIATLEELQKATKQSPNQMSPVFGCREMYTTQQLEILRNCLCADVADSSEWTVYVCTCISNLIGRFGGNYSCVQGVT